VSALLQESVLQAIRGLLPVKSILREYLHDDGDDEEEAAVAPLPTEIVAAEAEAKPEDKDEAKPEAKPVEEAKPEDKEEAKPEDKEEVKAEEAKAEEPKPVDEVKEKPPTIYIDTKPSVSFSNEHVMFDSTNLESNEINTQPFAEAENREDEEDEDVAEESIKITDEVLQMDADEDLSEDRPMPIEFETLA
jgi:hypothetical protein